jgi:hypothetical protein
MALCAVFIPPLSNPSIAYARPFFRAKPCPEKGCDSSFNIFLRRNPNLARALLYSVAF